MMMVFPHPLGARTVDALLEFAMQNAERIFQDPVTGKWSHEVPKDYQVP